MLAAGMGLGFMVVSSLVGALYLSITHRLDNQDTAIAHVQDTLDTHVVKIAVVETKLKAVASSIAHPRRGW